MEALIFYTSGTWTKPAGLTYAEIICTGTGGKGSGKGGGKTWKR